MGFDKESGTYIRNLLRLKVWTLFHDPPNKMWLIKEFGNEFRNKHEEIARNFAMQILNGTVFAGAPNSEELKFIKLVDYVASSFDRWALRVFKGRGHYIFYDRLHNTFSPEKSVKLEEPSSNNFDNFQRELNEILRKVDGIASKAGGGDEKSYRAVYNTLYLLFEALWYRNGCNPSLADTRVPTHTVFDHLYASALTVNMMLSGGLEGYFVVMDFPGIQRFISGRKAGDYWASSWILSNVMWATALHFAYEFGYDVILAPTPRLNPYTFRSTIAYLLSLVENGVEKDVFKKFYTVLCRDVKNIENAKDVLDKICSIARDIYGVRDYEELDFLLYQPLVPATISLILPPIAKSPMDLAKDVINSYKLSWSLLYDVVLDKLGQTEEGSTRSWIKRLLHSVLSKYGHDARVPPQGVTVYVINIKFVYDKIRECIHGSDEKACKDVLIELNRDDFNKVLNKIGNRDDVLNQLVLKLTYHITVSNYRKLISRCLEVDNNECGVVLYSTPRPFWIYDVGDQEGGKLKPVIHSLHDSIHNEEKHTWFTCNICGDEPAVLLFRKVVGANGVEDYNMHDVESIKKILAEYTSEIKEEKVVLDDIRKFIKPGEGVGIYCLFKRGVYLAYRDVLGIPSTDDVTLAWVSRLLHELNTSQDEKARNVHKAFIQRLDKYYREVIEYLYHYPNDKAKIRYVKDIEALAKAYGKRFDVFVKDVNEKLHSICIEILNEGQSYAEELKKYVMKTTGLSDVDSELGEYIKDRNGELPVRSVKSLCNLIKIPLHYAIVRGDADNIGKILRGEFIDNLEEYLNRMISSIERHVDGSAKIEVIRDSLKLWISLVSTLNLTSLPISPATHSAVSMALLLSAVDDYKVTKEFNGFLVFSGGDDILAFFPLASTLSGVKKLREMFEGKDPSGVTGFKRVGNGIPVTSALTTGRSFSVRIVSLMDIMSHEVSKAAELLENKAKEVRWDISHIVGSRSSFKKDSTVISDSRSQIYAVVTNKELGNGVYPYAHLLKAFYMLLLGGLSQNIPEDISSMIGKTYEYIEPEKLKRFIDYILKRNLIIFNSQGKDSIVKALIGSEAVGLHMVTGTIGKSEKINLALQLLDNFVRVMRRHV